MQKTILLMLLAFVSNPAAAEWVKIIDGITDAYVDRTTIRRNGNTARMWLLHDNFNGTSPDGKPFQSELYQYEFDCKDDRWRVLNMILISGRMGKGDVVMDARGGRPEDWQPVVPQSRPQNLWRIACGQG